MCLWPLHQHGTQHVYGVAAHPIKVDFEAQCQFHYNKKIVFTENMHDFHFEAAGEWLN